jgi:hypothetical protein
MGFIPEFLRLTHCYTICARAMQTSPECNTYVTEPPNYGKVELIMLVSQAEFLAKQLILR